MKSYFQYKIYQQGLFEGTKAFRGEDGQICLFRPEQNAIRMQIGAERICMPAPSTEQFVNAVKETALANRRWVFFLLHNHINLRSSFHLIRNLSNLL